MPTLKRYLSALGPLLCLIILVIFSESAIEGARTGLLLWAKVIVPTLLPFILLTNMMIHGATLPFLANHPFLKRLQPCILLSIFVGFLCGYPMGGKFVHDLFTGGFIDKKLANLLLVLCNNASPMFIIGYVIHYGLDSAVSPLFVFSVLYLPNISVFILRYIRYRRRPLRSATLHLDVETETLTAIIGKSINSILYIGVYIMLFSLITRLLSGYAAGSLLLPVASLEVTVGISLLKAAGLTATKKTALILALTAFGGCSSIAQTKSVANHPALSFLAYTIWKIILAGITGFLCLLLLP